MTHAPLACLAIAPVSNDRVFPPICISFLYAMNFLRGAGRPLITSGPDLIVRCGRMMGSGRWGICRLRARKNEGPPLGGGPGLMADYLRMPSLSMIER